MYVSVSSEKTNNYFKNELGKLGFDIIGVPCVKFYPQPTIIDNLKHQINDFDIVIITSPRAIEYLHEVFRIINKKLIFIVSGSSSYVKLRQYTKNVVYMPKHDAGSEAIISQILKYMDLRQKKIVLLHGKNASHYIQDYLGEKFGTNSYTKIVIYEQKWLDLDAELMKKIFLANSLQGIILTSSMYAESLFAQAKKFGYLDMLQEANFITLHIKIEQVLRKFGVKGHIFVSDTASNQSLVALLLSLRAATANSNIDLIGKLHDR